MGVLYVFSHTYLLPIDLHSAVFTLKYNNNNRKRKFYKLFYSCFIFWTMSVPLEAVLANGVIDIWHRKICRYHGIHFTCYLPT